ncbi:unnamed protein product [Phytophthora lilii]|uniref:RxLR effector protein n=1 Tax=Phytophthora lilii TaxID=2077276 RepID=A0A9W6TQ46_9STRA|nr:unnamed protein product [Phytophthora lilii]
MANNALSHSSISAQDLKSPFSHSAAPACNTSSSAMRLSYFFVAAAILVVSLNSVSAVDKTKVSKMAAPTSALSVNGVKGGARFLRINAATDLEAAGKMFQKVKESYIKKRLGNMLVDEKYAHQKFLQWYRTPGLRNGAIESVIKSHGEHFGTLYSQYIAYINRVHGVV